MSESQCDQSNGDKQNNNESAPLSTWLFLFIAVTFEIAGAISLRFSDGFTILLPTILALSSFTVALYLVSHVMKFLPVSIAYPIWAGGGTVGVALLGILALGESISTLKIMGIALVVLGVIIINRVSEKTSGC